MYKNIVFDFGGVMVDFDPYEYLVDLFGNRELEEEVYDLTFGSREWRLLDAGRITRREANERMLERAKAVGRGFEVEGVLDDFLAAQLPKGHLPRPLTVPSYAGAGRTMQKGWKILPRMCYTGRRDILSQVKKITQQDNSISAICNSTMLLLH